jgi:hypothetical protein
MINKNQEVSPVIRRRKAIRKLLKKDGVKNQLK